MKQFPNETTRREFLGGAIKAATALGVLGGIPSLANPLLAAVPKATTERRMPIGLMTYEWGMDWDLDTLLANLKKAEVYGVELRTNKNYKHGVEDTITADQRAEVKKRIADSHIEFLSLACGEQFEWPDPARLRQAIEAAKGFVKLSHDIGGTSLRVFPNQFREGLTREQTIEQIGKSLTEVGTYAADYNIEIALECHGPAGELPTIAEIMNHVKHPGVRVKLNSDSRDAAEFETRFNLVKDKLASNIHIHNLKNTTFPYQLQCDLLAKNGWNGWAMMENTEKVPDRVAAMVEQRQIWEAMVKNAFAKLERV